MASSCIHLDTALGLAPRGCTPATSPQDKLGHVVCSRCRVCRHRHRRQQGQLGQCVWTVPQSPQAWGWVLSCQGVVESFWKRMTLLRAPSWESLLGHVGPLKPVKYLQPATQRKGGEART